SILGVVAPTAAPSAACSSPRSASRDACPLSLHDALPIFGGIVTSILVSTFGEANLATAFLLVPWTMVIMMAVVVLALPGAKLRREDGTELFDLREMLAGFRPPKDKQFWFVYLGRLVFMVGLMLLVQTQTQQLIYHFELPLKTAASTAALLGIVLALGSLISTMISGPLSDKLRRRKAPAMV